MTNSVDDGLVERLREGVFGSDEAKTDRVLHSYMLQAADTITTLRAQLNKIEEERDRLREDADRYRWLRDISCPPHNFYISVPDEFHGVRYAPEEVDAYIDKARAALKESDQ